MGLTSARTRPAPITRRFMLIKCSACALVHRSLRPRKVSRARFPHENLPLAGHGRIAGVAMIAALSIVIREAASERRQTPGVQTEKRRIVGRRVGEGGQE